MTSSVLEAEGMERTHKFRQVDIADAVDITSAQKVCANHTL